MKIIFKQYVKIIGNALVGLAFGFAFFYFFLNIYHYQELRRNVYIDFSTDSAVLQLNQTLDHVNKNIEKFQAASYRGSLDQANASLWQTRLSVCVKSFQNETYQELLKKEKINVKDVYHFRESFESNVLNDCIVSHLYSLIGETAVNDDFILENQKLLQYYMDDLLQDTSYLKKDLYDNASYYFTTDISALAVRNRTKDGFYEVLSSYNRAAKFLELISDWYASRVGGAV